MSRFSNVMLRTLGAGTVVVAAACGGSTQPRPTATTTATLPAVVTTIGTTATPTSSEPVTPTTSAPGIVLPSSIGTLPPTVPPPAPPLLPPPSSVPSSSGRPWFAALRADGTLEAWAKDGKRLSVPTCATGFYEGADDRCTLAHSAASTKALWYVIHERNVGSSLYRASFSGGAPKLVSKLDLEESYRALAVSPDDRTVWIVHTYPGDSGASLDRREAGSVTSIATGAVSVALSPDGTRLAYSLFEHTFDGQYSFSSRLVIADVNGEQQRMLDLLVGAVSPLVIDDVAWAPDNRHLLFTQGNEYKEVHVLDVDSATSASDVQTPVAPIPGLAEGKPSAVQQACWSSSQTVALGTWYSPYAEAQYARGDVVDYDLRTSTGTPAGVDVFGQGRFGDGLACRDDGAVALVDAASLDPSAPRPSDLKVIRPDGTTTRLGRGYLAVLHL